MCSPFCCLLSGHFWFMDRERKMRRLREHTWRHRGLVIKGSGQYMRVDGNDKKNIRIIGLFRHRTTCKCPFATRQPRSTVGIVMPGNTNTRVNTTNVARRTWYTVNSNTMTLNPKVHVLTPVPPRHREPYIYPLRRHSFRRSPNRLCLLSGYPKTA